MYNGYPSITTPTANMKSWSGKQIASVANLKQRKIYMWTGSSDTTVGPNVMNQLKTQLANFYNSANVSYITTIGAVHTFPTDFNSGGDNSCGFSTSPYISDCNYDGAGAALGWIYGSLNARNTGTLSGSILSFDQSASYGAPGMDITGYLYVPQSCMSGATVCSLHVALHGCLQSYSSIGSQFIHNTGYNKWAGKHLLIKGIPECRVSDLYRLIFVLDTNNMIILYPQAIPDYTIHTIWNGGVLSNPNGCWDWVGWYGNNADQIGGKSPSRDTHH